MKKQFLLSAVLCLSLTAFGQKVHQLASPSGNIRISVELTDQIQYDVTQGNWKIQCKLPPKTKRFCPLMLK